MKMLVVAPDTPGCGISEHTSMLMESVRESGLIDNASSYWRSAAHLDPRAAFPSIPDLLHLNYHAGLHSRWTPDTIRRVKALGTKVLVTYHDSGVPNSEQCKEVCAAADYFVIHEPYDDLPAHGEYLRMGVPFFDGRLVPSRHPEESWRPMLGTVGHDFPWKCWDELAKITAKIGWEFMICTPAIEPQRLEHLQQLNPRTFVRVGWPTHDVVAQLHACDATAFTNVTHNTGQSAAILLGIAARKPVIALATCRQYRALFNDALGRTAITWQETFDDVAFTLSHFVRIERVNPAVLALAEQESWTKVGARYAQIYKQLLEGR